jgi:ribosomal protein L37AE/L43A
MKRSVKPPNPPGTTQHLPVACHYCGSRSTTIVDRRGSRVLRHCTKCKLTWVDEARDPSQNV